MVLVTTRRTGKRKAEQKVNTIDGRLLGGLAARTSTGVQMDYRRWCACLCLAKMRAASVSNTLRKSQKPLFHFEKTEFSF